MKKVFYALFFMFLFGACSPLQYSLYYTYEGNEHAAALGKSKNELLRTYGVPDKTVDDDGAGGYIMCWEKVSVNTKSGATSSAYGASAAGAVYNSNGVVGGGQSAAVSSAYGASRTTVDKDFVYLYMNGDNVCYDFKTNIGAKYLKHYCLDKPGTIMMTIAYSCMTLGVAAPIEIPWAIVGINKAKKNGQICK